MYTQSPLFNVAGHAIINGEYKDEILISSIKEVVAESDILHTIFNDGDIEKLNYSLESFSFAKCVDWMDRDARVPFRTGERGLKIAILKISEEKGFWYVKAHHTLFDGYAMSLFFNKVTLLYSAKINGEPQAIKLNKYFDFIDQELVYFSSRFYKEDKEFWIKRVKKRIHRKAFESAFKSQLKNSLISERKEITIERKLFEKIKDFSKSCNCSPYHYFITSLIILNNLYGNGSACIGIPVFNRPTRAFKNTLGPTVNMLPFSVPFDNRLTFVELLKKVRDELKDCYRHQKFPLGHILEELDQHGNIYNLTFSYQKISYLPYLGDAEASIVFNHNGEQQEDLVLHLLEYSETEDLKLIFDYKIDVFSDEILQDLIKNYFNLLENNLLNGDTVSSALKCLNKNDFRELVQDFNETSFVFPRNKSVLDLFEDQVTEQPNKIAVRFLEKTYTYQDLNNCSNQVAHYLMHELKIEGTKTIGIKLDRSFWLVAGILGILKTGSAYLPLDLNYPEERNNYLFKDSNCEFIFGSEELNDFKQKQASLPLVFKRNKIEAQDLAYLIYTSGSTGNPKGVMISHGNLTSFLHWCRKEFDQSNFDITYWVTSICFDLSIFELFFSLCAGKEVRVLDNALSIIDYIKKDKNILLNTVPGVVKMLVKDKVQLDRVTVINMAGESVPSDLIQSLETKRIEVRNLYGPSEDTTYSTCFRFFDNQDILIGKPIANTQAYILNEDLKPVPKGIKGELFLGGEGLSLGYFNKPELTHEKFIPNPFITGERIYRTGDFARWTSDGNLEFVGRVDNQLKIRGHRVEPGEVEVILQQYELVDLVCH